MPATGMGAELDFFRSVADIDTFSCQCDNSFLADGGPDFNKQQRERSIYRHIASISQLKIQRAFVEQAVHEHELKFILRVSFEPERPIIYAIPSNENKLKIELPPASL
jgi:hypothetical protein